MKLLLLAACVLGTALCAPQLYMEFDIHHAPAQAAPAIPAGVPAESLEVILPVDAQRQPIGGAVRGFIKQDVPIPNSMDTREVYIPFGFDVPAAAAPAAPAAAPAAPAAAAPLQPVVAAPAAQPKGDSDDDDED